MKAWKMLVLVWQWFQKLFFKNSFWGTIFRNNSQLFLRTKFYLGTQTQEADFMVYSLWRYLSICAMQKFPNRPLAFHKALFWFVQKVISCLMKLSQTNFALENYDFDLDFSFQLKWKIKNNPSEGLNKIHVARSNELRLMLSWVLQVPQVDYFFSFSFYMGDGKGELINCTSEFRLKLTVNNY